MRFHLLNQFFSGFSAMVTARNKAFTASFLKESQDSFVTMLQDIKEDKPEFSYSGVHIEVQKAKEAAVAPRIQPKELKEEPAPEPAPRRSTPIRPQSQAC